MKSVAFIDSKKSTPKESDGKLNQLESTPSVKNEPETVKSPDSQGRTMVRHDDKIEPL
jgi:hypothetical protein